MNKIILTMNTGGKWIADNVLRSHENAAHRWGARYVQVTEETDEPFRTKAACLKNAKADRVVWLDGDCIVRFDCPNLFDRVPVDHIGGVPNFQEDTHGGMPWSYHEIDWFWCQSQNDRYDIGYDPKTFMNSGVLVYSLKHHSEIWNTEFPAVPCAEQALMNFRVQMLGIKQTTLAYTFNRIWTSAWEPGPMSYFIQHLAAFDTPAVTRTRAQREEAIRAIDWTKRAALEAVAA